MQCKAVGEWILVEIIEPEEEKTAGGIVIPKMDEKKPALGRKTKRAKILDIGAKVENPNFEVGDIVAIYYDAGLDCEDFGALVKEGNIMAVLKE